MEGLQWKENSICRSRSKHSNQGGRGLSFAAQVADPRLVVRLLCTGAARWVTSEDDRMVRGHLEV
jgi:hypothetical protein